MRRKNPFIYYGGKLAGFAVSVFVLSLAVFYIARLAPGDPLVSYYGDRAEKMTVQAQRSGWGWMSRFTSSISAGWGGPFRGISASPISTKPM